MKVSPVAVTLLLLFVVGSEQAEEDTRFGSLHLTMLKDISTTLQTSRDEKQQEFEKMKAERAKQRETLEAERKKLQDDLRDERAKQFEQIKKLNLEQHEQFRGILNQVIATVASTEEKKLGFHHLSLLKNISHTLEGSKEDNLRHFQELLKEDSDHHARVKQQILEDQQEVKKERTEQFNELKDTAIQQHKELKTVFQNIMSLLNEAKDCYELFKNGISKSGIYVIKPDGTEKNFYVYCDMETDGGGWTVIQRRRDYGVTAESFNRGWEDYKDGFGKLTQEFWLGNDRISALTKQKETMLRVDVMDFKNKPSHSVFKNFIVDNEQDDYRLTVGEFVGKTAQEFARSSGQTFSTQDRNSSKEKSCAIINSSGWWFAKECEHTSNLNGARKEDTMGAMMWDGKEPLSYSQMMVRPMANKAPQFSADQLLNEFMSNL